MAVSARLKELRKTHNLTQKQLAEAIDMPIRSIINYENSLREPNSKAMATLEQFFGVSGAFLRGESDDQEAIYKWEDPEMMATIREGYADLFNNLLVSIRASSAVEQKMVYDILIEIKHLLNVKNTTKEQKKAAALLLQDAFVITNNFIDTCTRSTSADANRNTNAIEKSVANYNKALKENLPDLLIPDKE